LDGFRELTFQPNISQIYTQHSEAILADLTKKPKYYPFSHYGDRLRITQGLYLARVSGNLTDILDRYVHIPMPPTLPIEVGQISEGDAPAYSVNQFEFVEGTQNTAERQFFARNRLLRETAIQKFGVKCTVCGFDFESKYGVWGRGYIEVHHLETMASRGATSSGTEGWTTSVNDVRPLCANCHRMAHRRSPPLSIDELKRLIALA
jgi:hypothetical protein